jgi:hypothetical protein
MDFHAVCLLTPIQLLDLKEKNDTEYSFEGKEGGYHESKVCMYVCIYKKIFLCMYVCMYLFIFKYMHMSVNTYIYMYVYIY